MKRTLLLASLMVFIGVNVSGQSIERFVISSMGGSFSNATLSIDQTVGEAVIATFSSPTVVLTQGFQQPPLSDVSIPEVGNGQLPISVFPNPGPGKYTIDIPPTQSPNTLVEVFDMLGQLLYSREYNTNPADHTRIELILPYLATGTYHLRVSAGNASGSLRLVNLSGL